MVPRLAESATVRELQPQERRIVVESSRLSVALRCRSGRAREVRFVMSGIRLRKVWSEEESRSATSRAVQEARRLMLARAYDDLSAVVAQLMW